MVNLDAIMRNVPELSLAWQISEDTKETSMVVDQRFGAAMDIAREVSDMRDALGGHFLARTREMSMRRRFIRRGIEGE